MLKITVEIWPKGLEEEKRVLCTAKIFNDLTGTLTSGNYKAVFSRTDDWSKVWKKVELKGFPRRKLGPWHLLSWALEALFKEKRNSPE